MKKKIITALLITVMALSLVACGSTDTSGTGDQNNSNDDSSNEDVDSSDLEGKYVLGTSQPLTGANAQAAQATLNGIKLAVDEINADGGFNGQEIELITYDDQGLPEEAVKVANKMVEIDKVDGVIGHLLSTSQMAQGKLINDAETPTVAIGLSPSFMEENWEYVVRGSLNSNYVMAILAQNMVDLGIESLAIFSGQDDSSKTSAESMQREAEAVGITITTVETYVDGDNDYSGQVAKIINTDPDAVFLASFANVQPVAAKQLRQFGFDGLCFNKEVFQADSLKVAGSAANYWAFAYPYVSYENIEDAEDPAMREFLQKYYDAYGELPAHEGAMRGYDATMILNEGTKNAGSNDGDAVMDGIFQISDYEGLAGTFDYTEGDGEGIRTCSSYIVIDEKYTLLDGWVESGGYDEFKQQLGN